MDFGLADPKIFKKFAFGRPGSFNTHCLRYTIYFKFSSFKLDDGKQNLDDQDDPDFELHYEQTSNICPISSGPIIQATKNKICGHVFDYESIIMFIEEQQRRRRVPQCPISGCINKKKLSKEDFIQNFSSSIKTKNQSVDNDEFDLLPIK